MSERNVHVTVIYKSGAKMEFDCVDITVSIRPNGEITRVEWKDARPEPYALGLGEVAAIYVEEPEKVSDAT